MTLVTELAALDLTTARLERAARRAERAARRGGLTLCEKLTAQKKAAAAREAKRAHLLSYFDQQDAIRAKYDA